VNEMCYAVSYTTLQPSAHACTPNIEHFHSFIAYTLHAKHVVSVTIFTEQSLSSSLSLSL